MTGWADRACRDLPLRGELEESWIALASAEANDRSADNSAIGRS
jgi:hypothetical protein